MAFTVHDEGRQKSTEDAGAPNAEPPQALAAASAPVPAGAPKAERARAPEKEEPLAEANPVLEPALALAPKAEAGAAPNAPAPDAARPRTLARTSSLSATAMCFSTGLSVEALLNPLSNAACIFSSSSLRQRS